MKSKLVEPVAFQFTSGVIAQLSTVIDESEASVARALGIAVPLVLSTLADRVGHDLTASDLLALVQQAEETDVLKQLNTPQQLTDGPDATPGLLGASYAAILSQVSLGAATRHRASAALLHLTTAATMGVLGRFAAENEFSATDLVYWLRARKGSIGATMLPLPGHGTTPDAYLPHKAAPSMELTTMPATAAGPDQDTAPLPAGKSLRIPWQWGGMLLLAVCLGYFFGNSRIGNNPPRPAATAPAVSKPDANTRFGASLIEPDATTAPPPPPEAALPAAAEPAAPAPVTATPAPTPSVTKAALATAAPAAGRPASSRPGGSGETMGRYDQDRDTYIYDTGRPITLTLADGTTQKVGANSTENRLYAFLASPKVQVDSVNRTKGWINFDRINFEPGKAMLTPESALQLGNIASILNTFPRAIVKIGGYTDSTGEALVNYQLSEDRAHAAMLTLVSMGVSTDRLQAKGYGPKYFVKPNNTPTGRALNRRISIRVVHK